MLNLTRFKRSAYIPFETQNQGSKVPVVKKEPITDSLPLSAILNAFRFM
jgi:hypothetical protein